ncbi:hypothetical protein [Tianweitania aestuarii]|nr:hypothetical protein [Tianweitania aestuarii]
MRLFLIWGGLFASIVLVFIAGGSTSMFDDKGIVASADAATE